MPTYCQPSENSKSMQSYGACSDDGSDNIRVPFRDLEAVSKPRRVAQPIPLNCYFRLVLHNYCVQCIYALCASIEPAPRFHKRPRRCRRQPSAHLFPRPPPSSCLPTVTATIASAFASRTRQGWLYRAYLCPSGLETGSFSILCCANSSTDFFRLQRWVYARDMVRLLVLEYSYSLICCVQMHCESRRALCQHLHAVGGSLGAHSCGALRREHRRRGM